MSLLHHNHKTTQTCFMQSPLMTWLRTLLEEENCNDYGQLCKGVFLNKAWLQIDPHPSQLPDFGSTSEVYSSSSSSSSSFCIKNLNTLLQNIKNFYESVLDQLIVLRLPDVTSIALNGNDDETFLSTIQPNNPLYGLINYYSSNYNCDDMQTILLLILGCAVQCEHKEIFIEKIKQLDISTQHSIVECIQQITDNPESVFLINEWSLPPVDVQEKDRLYSIFVNHINSLTKERDQLYQRVVDLSCELVNLTIQASSSTSSSNNVSISDAHNLSLSNSSLNLTNNGNNALNHCDQKSHYLVELAEVKSKLRRLQQELEEKHEIISELKEVIEQKKVFCNKLRHDNLELTQEARTAKAYRDEIDVLNERVRKIDRLEAEAQRYRDKMNELEFCKTRVEELREDNRILGETKTMLEEQLETSRKRAEKIPELEEKILKLNTHSNELNLQRELDRNQIERLIEEISHLRSEKKFANEELAKVQSELTDVRAQIRLKHETMLVQNEEGNLYDQMNQDTSKRMIKLEHENKKLQSFIEDYQNNYIDIDSVLSLFNNIDVISSQHKNSETSINSDNNSESGYDSNKTKIEKLSLIKEYIGKINLNCSQIKQLESDKIVLDRESKEIKLKLQDMASKLETMERNFTQISVENQKLSRNIEQKTKKIDQYMSEMEDLENENQKLVANADSLRLSLKKMNDLEMEMTNLETDKQRYEQENKSLEKEINRMKASIQHNDRIIDEQSDKLSNYELENKRLKKEIDVNGQLSQRLKESEKDNKDLMNTLSVQKKTLATLQRDLVEEKLNTQKLADEFGKIIELLNKCCAENHCFLQNGDLRINYAKKDIHSLIDGSVSNQINECLQVLIEKFPTQKDSHIEELQTRLNDLKENNQEMQTLINTLKRQLNIDEKSDPKSSLDSLNELQRRIFSLEDENIHLKEEMNNQKKNHIQDSNVQSDQNEIKLNMINEVIDELKNKNANIEVENSLLKSQNSSLESQTIELQEQMVAIQDSIDKLRIKCEEYEVAHRLLIEDNESLQEIHQQLTADYENLTKNHGILKQSYKKLKLEYKTLEEKLNSQMKQHEELIDSTEQELKSLRLQNDENGTKDSNQEEKILLLTNEYKTLNEEHKRLQTEHKMLQNIYKKLRSDNNDLKLKHTELQGETAECKDQMNALNVEVSKLSSYCEMVAITNTTLETQRKKLATQSASLLTQYNDLLIELSCGCERSVKDKLHELFNKKEKLEKMFKDYDISFEKNMSRVSSKSSFADDAARQQQTTMIFDDSVYGFLWEAETPPIQHSKQFYTSSALLKQYSINNSEKCKNSPPRIPPRPNYQRQTINLSQIGNSKETSIEFTPNGPFFGDKMSINISSTRNNSSTQNQMSNAMSNHGGESHSLDGTISKLQITATSPFVKSISTIGSPPPPPPTGNFMRGSFKSNSVNYGNLMRKSVGDQMSNNNSKMSFQSDKLNGPNTAQQQQLFCFSSSRIRVSNSPRNFNMTPTTTTTPQPPSSTLSLHSDSSSSSNNNNQNNSVIEESEIETTGMDCCSNDNNSNNIATRSRITITSDTIQTTMCNGFNNKDNISIQINSNALNDNSIESTGATANTNTASAVSSSKFCSGSNGIAATENVNSASNNSGNNNGSNSIWYEYGCV